MRGGLISRTDNPFSGTLGTVWHNTHSHVISIIEQTPAVDAVEVRHGRWIINQHYGDYECSECGSGDFSAIDFKKHNMKYCPNCGAKMDAEVE